MIAAPLSSAGLDPARRKLLYRSRHCGLRELDLLLGGFAEARLVGLAPAELVEFERLLDLPDREVLAWMVAGAARPEGFASGLLDALAAFHRQANPLPS